MKVKKFQLGNEMPNYEAMFKGYKDYKTFQNKLDSTLNAKLDSAVAAGNKNFRVSFTGQAPINPVDTMSVGTMQGFTNWIDKKLNTPKSGIVAPSYGTPTQPQYKPLYKQGNILPSYIMPKIPGAWGK